YDHYCRTISVEVLRRSLLNVRRGQRFNLRTKVVDEVFVEIVRVDRTDASNEPNLARQLDGEVTGTEFFRCAQFLICYRQHTHAVQFVKDLEQRGPSHFIADKCAGEERACLRARVR